MIAKITPPDRPAYQAELKAPPVYSTLELGGYSTATVVQGRVSGDKASRMLYADVELWSSRGPCWRGVVSDYDRDGTMHCVGPQQVLGWHNAPVLGPTANPAAIVAAGYAYAPSWLLPAGSQYLAWIGSNTLTLAHTIESTAGPVSSVVADALKYDTWQWGWYHEFLGGAFACVPHYAAPSSAIEYIITLSAEDASGFFGKSLEAMTDLAYTTWSGGIEDTQDADASHYLVQIGRHKTSWQSATNAESAADAALIAAAELADQDASAGKTQVKPIYQYRSAAEYQSALNASASPQLPGALANSRAHQLNLVSAAARSSFLGRRSGSENTSTIQLASGLAAHLPSIRSGSLARVIGLPDGPVDLRIAGATVTGERSISVDLGDDTGRADSLWARIA